MMNDKNKIIVGLTIFVLIIIFPIWFNLGKKSIFLKPELTEKAKNSKNCILLDGKMASKHMHLLDFWRHSVVRNAKRVFINGNGQEYEMSLSNTCLDCHSNKSNFCDRCHDYASVQPYCWDCHIYDSKGDE